MKQYKLYLEGEGNSAEFHKKAIKFHDKNFSLTDDIQLADAVIISNSINERLDSIHELSKLRKKLILEKPFCKINENFDFLQSYFGSFHPLYSVLLRKVQKYLEFDRGVIKTKVLGKLTDVVLRREAEYLVNRELTQKARQKVTGIDNFYNSLATLLYIFKTIEINKVEIVNNEFPEADSVVSGIINSIPTQQFQIITKWSSDQDVKMTEFQFENGFINIDYSKMLVYGHSKDEQFSISEDFSGIGERVEEEYKLMYEDIYNFMEASRNSTFEISKKLLETLKLINEVIE